MNATIVQAALCKTRLRSRPLPSVFFFPGLNTAPVFQNDRFPSARDMSLHTPIILQEYLRLKERRRGENYETGEEKLHDGRWEWHSYIDKGTVSSEFSLECPRTAELLDSFVQPRLMRETPFSFAFFSTLRSHSSISPHYGPTNIRIRCHLPLIVPQGDCGFRVGGERIVSSFEMINLI